MKNDSNSAVLFSEIYEKYYKKILQYFRKDFAPEDAEDLTQQSFLQLWAWLPGGKIKNQRALIYRIAKNVKYDKFRKNALLLESMLIPEEFDVGDNGDPFSIVDLKLSVKKLSPKEQQLLLLSLDGYNSTEIGKLLEISPSAVRTRLQKIRKKLK